MTTLGNIIDRRLADLDARKEYLLGRVSSLDIRNDLRELWTPHQTKMQLQRALSVQRRKRLEREQVA